MPRFEINFVAPVDVAATVTVTAATSDAAKKLALRDHAQGKVSWLFGSVDIGGYTGPVSSLWAVPAGAGAYLVSLKASVKISASAGSVDADDVAHAEQKGQVLHAAGLLPWNYRGIPLGTFTGVLGPLWAVHQSQEQRLPSSVSISGESPSFGRYVSGRSGLGGISGGPSGGIGGIGGLDGSPVPSKVTFSITPKSGTATLLQAVVTGDAGVPVGTITFSTGGVTIGTASLTNGAAVFLYRQGIGSAGDYPITASYGGSFLYNPSVSDPIVFSATISVGSPTVVPNLFLDCIPQSGVTTTFTMTAASVSGAPTGFAVFKSGEVYISGLIPLVQKDANTSTASLTSSVWSAGANPVQAFYLGDGTFTGLVSPPSAFTYVGVDPGPAPDANFVYGTDSNLYASVTEGATGQLDFVFNGQTFDTERVDEFGVGVLHTAVLPPGNYSVYASYPGDTGYAPSQSSPLRVVIHPASTFAYLAVSPNPTSTGQTVFCVASFITDAGSSEVRQIGGTVEFFYRTPPRPVTVPSSGTFFLPAGDSVSFGLASVGADGNAYLDTTDIPIGEWEVYCHYKGNPYYAESFSGNFVIAVSKGTPGMEVTLSPNPASIGASVLMTANLFPVGPTGTVQFIQRTPSGSGFIDTVLGTCSIDPNGVASFALTTVTGGISTVSNLLAKYLGDDSFFSVTSAPPDLDVLGYSTTTTFVQSVPNPFYGQAFHLNVTVTPADLTSPTGTVGVFDGNGHPYGVATLTGGMADFVFSNTSGYPPPGSSLHVSYNGDSTHVPSTSASAPTGTQPGPTATNLVSSVNPVALNGLSQLTAHVSTTYGGDLDGSVIFKSGGAVFGSAPVNPFTGDALFFKLFHVPGPQNITAEYSSSGGLFRPSVSSTSVQGVQAPANIGVGTSPSNPYSGQSIRFTAVLSSSTSGTPTGTVTFSAYKYSGSSGYAFDHSIGTASLAPNGSASIAAPLGPGFWQIRVSYPGDNTFSPCNNASIAQYLYVAYTPTAVSLTVNPQFFPHYGYPVALQATVTGADGAPINSGTVYFYSDSGLEVSAPVTNGIANATTYGYFQSYMYAYYSGDSTHQSNSSPQITVYYGYG